MEEEKKLLAWFLGPKSENATFLEEAVMLVLRDYFHWRRNYFPGDNVLLSRQAQRELEPDFDSLYQNILELLAELRRNFPFYSPRYIAHMLSDTVLTSIIGYIAGLMYNPNNVTPEAAPVTVNLEIRACNVLLQMLGFNPPPEIPKELNETAIDNYRKKLETQFGWGHLTLGGTTANLEALWVARAIRYSPLAIWDIARQHELSIEVKLPSGTAGDIKGLTARQLLLIKPNEAIYLLARYVDAYRLKHGVSIQDASKEAYDLLKTSSYHLSRGVATLFSEFPPVIFVSGTGHYSIDKAADILGVGQGNIEIVLMDSSFRMDVSDLEKKIEYALAKKKLPLAVIPIVGTTEEGAVDPVHKIIELRAEFEQRDVSFWVHVDAAWGGYIRALLNLSAEDELLAIASKASRRLGLEFTTIQGWHKTFFEYIGQQLERHVSEVSRATSSPRDHTLTEKRDKIRSWEAQLNNNLKDGDFEGYIRNLRRFAHEHGYLEVNEKDFAIDFQDRVDMVNEFASDVVSLQHGRYLSEVPIRWGSKEVCAALIKIPESDSVTIDPHKMGYVSYPCGMVAFRNDRVRHFVQQEAPYITSVRQDILIHMPPEHIEDIRDNPRIQTDAFARFIVEGSRPGAAASALWLTVRTIPPTTRAAGLIIKSSVLGARELYEWLVHWEKIMTHNHIDTDYQFVPFTLYPPDTNIVIFGVRKKTSNSLTKMNELSKLVYGKFTIQVELGEREYSYAQRFFLSRTEFREPRYPFEALKPLFIRYFGDDMDRVRNEYKMNGLVVLRATVMTPYLWLARNMLHQHILREFMQELSAAASNGVKEMK